jgi:hypothetical protein
VAVGQHVDVGMRHAALIQRADRIRKASVRETAFAHQGPQALAEWLVAVLAHLDPSEKILTVAVLPG